MNNNLYDNSIKPLTVRLQAMQNILKKLQEHCQTQQLDEAVFLNTRLFPDMFPFIKQVQVSTDMLKGAVKRLTSIEVPAFEDNETSAAQLIERIQKLLDFLATIDSSEFTGAENKEVIIKTPQGHEYPMTGWTYTQHFLIPNVYFHLATAYNILRSQGIALGKMDFISPSNTI